MVWLTFVFTMSYPPDQNEYSSSFSVFVFNYASKESLAQLNSSIISFICRKKRPRLRYSFLCLHVKRGGLSASSILFYQLAAQFKFLLEWFRDDPNSTLLWCESASLDRISLLNLLYISPGKASVLVKDNLVLKNMLKIWHQVRKLEGYANCFSLLTPLHANPDIPPGLWAGLIHWSRRGMKVVRHLVQDGLILTCHEVKSKFAMSNNDLLTFLQVQNFIILNQKTSLVDSLFLL